MGEIRYNWYMTTSEANTSIVSIPTVPVASEPSFIGSTNRKVNATMRGFF